MLAACKKNGYDKFDDAMWEKESYNYLDGQIHGNIYGDALFDNKVLRIQSLGELDSIGTLENPNLTAEFSSFDFAKNNLFVVLFEYDGKGHEKVTKSKFRINESTNSILFDFKVKVDVGGSGMAQFTSLYYFTIPIEKSSYDISGSIEMDEKSSGFQLDDHDFTSNYVLF